MSGAGLLEKRLERRGIEPDNRCLAQLLRKFITFEKFGIVAQCRLLGRQPSVRRAVRSLHRIHVSGSFRNPIPVTLMDNADYQSHYYTT